MDASCLRRGLILALQLRQQTQRLVLCVNLMDEAARRGITPQIRRLGQLLDVPVVATAARSGKGLAELRHQAAEVCRREPWEDGWKLTYVPPVEAALGMLETGMSRRRAVALLWGSPPTEGEQSLWQRAQQRLGALSGQALRDSLTASVVALAEEIGRQCVRCAEPDPHAPDRRLDRLLTSRLTGFPVMLLLLGLVFYLTIQGANAPSRLLSRWLTALEEPLRGLLAGAPWWVQGAVVDGIYRTEGGGNDAPGVLEKAGLGAERGGHTQQHRHHRHRRQHHDAVFLEKILHTFDSLLQSNAHYASSVTPNSASIRLSSTTGRPMTLKKSPSMRSTSSAPCPCTP